MRVTVKVHSHDTGLPEHDQVQFHTPEYPGGLMVLRVPKGSPLPPIGRIYHADFTDAEAPATAPAPASEPVLTDRTADTLGDQPPTDNAHVAEGAERFDDSHGADAAGSDQGGA